MKVNFKSLLFNVLVPLMLSFIVAMLLPYDKSFYESLVMPFRLPPIVFTIVWSILYILMGLSAYILENSNCENSKDALKIYYLQLIINLAYTPVFFYFKSLIVSSIIVVVLLILVIMYTMKVYNINKIAFYLLIPYVLWLFVATYLQLSILFLN